MQDGIYWASSKRNQIFLQERIHYLFLQDERIAL